MEYIQRLEELENIIQSANSTFQNEAKTWRNNSHLKTVEEFRKDSAQISDLNKLLAIGIIGRVKAGKSSLLNALLFDGKDILPKAATPMTAALTIMEYSEQVRAEAEFYTEKDLAEIRKGAANIPTLRAQLIAEKTEELKKEGKVKPERIAERAESAAKRALKDHPDYALFEQNEQIGNRPLPSPEKGKIQANSVDELMGKLSQYVGANGEYTPFTKSVRLYLPFESLKGLQIIDTPGVNDPIVSRGKRTEQELSRCDVVFVVSPSGQFMSAEDMGLLSRVTNGEGIGEAYLVASQADTQLIGIADKFPNAEQAFQFLAEELKAQAQSTLDKHKEQLSNVIERFKKHEVICSSSIAYVMNKYFHDRSNWDETANTVWNNLCLFFPNDFNANNAQAILQRFANIDKVQTIIDDVKPRRKAILKAKLGELAKGQEGQLAKFLETATAYLDEKSEELKNSDIAETERKIDQLRKQKLNGVQQINSEFSYIVTDLKSKLNKSLSDNLKRTIRGIDTDKQGTESETKRESYEVKVGERSTSSWWKPWTWGDTESIYETRYRDYTVSHEVVYATQIKDEIKKGLKDINDRLNDIASSVIDDWKSNTKYTIRGLIRSTLGDENTEIKQTERIVNTVFKSLPIAEFCLSTNLPASLDKSGSIRMNSGGRQFLEAAIEYVSSFEEKANREIKVYLANIDALSGMDIGKDLFAKLEQEAKQLQADISAKETRLKEMAELKKKLAYV